MSNYSAWEVDSDKFPLKASLKYQIAFVCHYGLLAPSVHNTQPWKFKIGRDILSVFIDKSRLLTHGDPTGRQAYISIGACIENLLLAGDNFGMRPQLLYTPKDGSVAVISFRKATGNIEHKWLDNIKKRTTNRSIFERQALDTKTLTSLRNSWHDNDTFVAVTSDRKLIETVADLSARGIGMALTIPELRKELAAQIRYSHTKKTDGMTATTLRPGKMATFLTPLYFHHPSVASKDSKYEALKLMSSSALIIVFTRGDTASFWIKAGRAYERTILTATAMGLAHSTSAATVEAPDFHQEIEKLCKTKFRLQTITRIGYTNISPPHSPRRTVDEVITFV